MEEPDAAMLSPLAIFALDPEIPALRLLLNASQEEALPFQFGTSIAGEATPQELDAPEWESVFLRWTDPELHDVALLAVYLPEEPEGEDLLQSASALLAEGPKDNSRAVLEQHLLSVKRIYALEPLPALRDAEEHEAWSGIDLILRTLAEASGGVIYAEGEGFYSPEGDPFYTPDVPELEEEEWEKTDASL